MDTHMTVPFSLVFTGYVPLRISSPSTFHFKDTDTVV